MRTAPTPDIEGIVNRGQERKRRRNTMRIGLAAAAVLLVGGSIYGIAQIGDGDPDSSPADNRTDTPTDTVPGDWEIQHAKGGSVDPGTYRTYVGVSDSGSIEADIALDGSNWTPSNDPVAFDGANFAGVGVYHPLAVANGCGSAVGGKEAAAQPQALADQLAGMPRSTVVQEPTSTEAFGYAALHLRLRVNNAWCGGDPDAYQVAETLTGTRAISFFDVKPEGPAGRVIIDFWVMDVNGTAVVVHTFHTEDAPQSLVDQAARARESVTFVTEE